MTTKRKAIVFGGTPSDASVAESMPCQGLIDWRSLNRRGFGGSPPGAREPLDFLLTCDRWDADLVVGISGGSYHALAYAEQRTPAAFVVIIAGMVPRPFFDTGLDSCQHKELFTSLATGFEGWRTAFKRSPKYDHILSSCRGPAGDVELGIYFELKLLYAPWNLSTLGIRGVWVHPRDDSNVPLPCVERYLDVECREMELQVIPGTHEVSLSSIITEEAVDSWSFTIAKRKRSTRPRHPATH